MLVPVRLVVAGKEEAVERSKRAPGVLFLAIESYVSGKKGKPPVSVKRNLAFRGRYSLVGALAAQMLVLLSAAGSATRAEMGDAVYGDDEDGGPEDINISTYFVKRNLTKALRAVGLDLESFMFVDPAKPRYRVVESEAVELRRAA